MAQWQIFVLCNTNNDSRDTPLRDIFVVDTALKDKLATAILVTV